MRRSPSYNEQVNVTVDGEVLKTALTKSLVLIQVKFLQKWLHLQVLSM